MSIKWVYHSETGNHTSEDGRWLIYSRHDVYTLFDGKAATAVYRGRFLSDAKEEAEKHQDGTVA